MTDSPPALWPVAYVATTWKTINATLRNAVKRATPLVSRATNKFVPTLLHLWLLRLVLHLPGLDPSVGSVIRRYVDGQPIPVDKISVSRAVETSPPSFPRRPCFTRPPVARKPAPIVHSPVFRAPAQVLAPQQLPHSSTDRSSTAFAASGHVLPSTQCNFVQAPVRNPLDTIHVSRDYLLSLVSQDPSSGKCSLVSYGKLDSFGGPRRSVYLDVNRTLVQQDDATATPFTVYPDPDCAPGNFDLTLKTQDVGETDLSASPKDVEHSTFSDSDNEDTDEDKENVCPPQAAPYTLILPQDLPPSAFARPIVSSSCPYPYLTHGDQAFWVTSVLGSGAYGDVFLAQDAYDTNKEYAVKVVRKGELYYMADFGSDFAQREMDVWKAVTGSRRPFLVHLLSSFDDDECIFYVMRLYHETLQDLLSGPFVLDMEDIRLYAAELLSAVHSLHSRHIMHLDIKPWNIFIAPDGHLALGDFGFAVSPAPGTGPFDQWCTGEQAGTPGYWAPEIRLHEPGKGGARASSDVYSMGIVVLEMALQERTRFFGGKETDTVAINASMAAREVPYDILEEINPLLCDLIRKMLGTVDEQGEPAGRWTTTELLEHPFFAIIDFEKLEQGLYTPKYRPKPPARAPIEAPDFCCHGQNYRSEVLQGPLSEMSRAVVQQLDADLQFGTFKYTCPEDCVEVALNGFRGGACDEGAWDAYDGPSGWGNEDEEAEKECAWGA